MKFIVFALTITLYFQIIMKGSVGLLQNGMTIRVSTLVNSEIIT